MSGWARRAALLVLAPVLLACASEADPSAVVAEGPAHETTTTTTAEIESTTTTLGRAPAAAEALFRKEATGTVHDAEAMRELTVPGSDAALYAEYAIAIARSRETCGCEPWTDDVQVGRDGTIEVCGNQGGGCATMGDFVVDGAQVSDFTIEGVPIGERVTPVSGDEAAAGAASARVLSVYRHLSSDFLTVAVEITTGDRSVHARALEASYTDPSGSVIPLDPSGSLYPTADIPPATTVVVLFDFTRAAPGGQLTFTLTDVASSEALPVQLEA